MLDLAGNANMYKVSNTTFVADRFGIPYSALNLNGGYTKVPPGVYFDTGEFTITAWIYPLQLDYGAILIDFGNDPVADNLVFKLNKANTAVPALALFNSSNQLYNVESNVSLSTGKWQFLTGTFNGSILAVYINGTLTGSFRFDSYTLPKITRYYNFIGKSNRLGNGFSSSYVDDLRFYNVCLSSQ